MKANILNKTLVSAAICGSFVSASSFAADGTFDLSFRTVPDVAIVQTTGLDFGGNLKLAVNTTCTLVVGNAAASNAGTVVNRQAAGGATAAGTSFQTRTGDCDNNDPGVAGVYTITGASGVDVKITVNPIAPGAGNLSYVPAGYVVHYDGSADGDTLLAITSATQQTAQLASASDTGTGGSPIPGQTKLFLGGTITAQNQLTAGTTYNTQQFVVDVIY